MACLFPRETGVSGPLHDRTTAHSVDMTFLPDPRAFATYAALERYETRRHPQLGFREPILPAESGVVHAYTTRTAGSTRDPEFFEDRHRDAICGAAVRVRLNVRFDPADGDVCRTCAAKFAQGLRYHFRPVPRDDCQATVRPGLPGYPQMLGCQRLRGHQGPHEADAGSWVVGAEDFTPDGDYVSE